MAAVENGGVAFAEVGKDRFGASSGDAVEVGGAGVGGTRTPRGMSVKTGEGQCALHAGGIGGGKKSAPPSIRKWTTGRGGGLQIPVIKQTTDESALKVNVGLGAWSGTKKDPNRTPITHRPIVPPLGFQLLHQHPQRLDSQTVRPLLESLVLSTRRGRWGASVVAGESAWERRGALTDRGARGQMMMEWGGVSGAASPRGQDESVMTARSGLETSGRGVERHHRGIDMMFMTSKRSRGLMPHRTGLADAGGDGEQSFESVASSTRKVGALFKESSWGSGVSAASTRAHHLLSPSVSPTQRPPHRVKTKTLLPLPLPHGSTSLHSSPFSNRDTPSLPSVFPLNLPLTMPPLIPFYLSIYLSCSTGQIGQAATLRQHGSGQHRTLLGTRHPQSSSRQTWSSTDGPPTM